MKYLKKTIVILITLLIIGFTVFQTVSLSSTSVSLSFIPAPNIDVVLAKGKTSTDVTNFNSDLMSALASLNIDTTKVNISSVETENVNIESAFSWNKDLSSSIGAITITSNGQNVEMVGNQTLAGKNAIWIIPSENQEQKFTFNYNIDYGDSFNAAGMLLKVEKVGNELFGYMLSFNKTSKTYYVASSSNLGAVWKFRWTIGTNSTALTCYNDSATVSSTTNYCKLVKPLTIDQSGTLTVSVDSASIKISGGGLSGATTINVDSGYDGIGFGFFSDHYSHNCSRIGSFKLTGINLEATTVKRLSEVLREPDWRDDAIKVVVNVNDVVSDELSSNSSMGELLTRLINEDINFAVWGKSVNQSQYQNLINANNGNGKFINNTSYSNSITSTAQYIKTLVDKLQSANNYLILGEPIKIVSNPSGILTNTANSAYPYGRWKISHNYQYFENNLGQFEKANQYLNNMVTGFDKTGEFKITFEDQAITPQSVYVHRRPIAIINNSRSGTSISLSSASYDLDSYSTGNNGIYQEEWKYRKTTDTSWTTGKLTTVASGSDYIIQLRVKDYQGAWSIPESIYTTSDASALPIASFKIQDNEISKYETLVVTDTSYDPYGGTITGRTWEVYKDGTKVYSGSTPKVSGYTATGVYVMKLTVTNNRGLTSETYSRTFQIVDDTTAPSILVTPENGGWAKQITVNLRFTDSQSGFKNYKYAITDSQATPTTWSSLISKATDTITITAEGNKYLHIIATDNARNVSDDRITGIYKIDRTAPKVSIVGDTSTIQINSFSMKASATDTYSGVKKFTIAGQSVTNGTVTFVKNGTYAVYAEDNVGWTTTQNITINNIYYQCNAGLNHPIYSSSYDSCPICESFKGLSVTNATNVYDGQNHRVQYNNPKNATIVEYYNGTKTLPNKVGNYQYELKVVYQGAEYETGVKGTYIVTKKDITITNIKSPDKIYDGTDRMTVTAGRLVGICSGDTVSFTLPSVAYAENKNVGNHKIRLGSNIVLTGTDAYNYNLIQPTYGSITGNIVKRTISTAGIQGKTRKYDKTNIVEIIGGSIVNGVSGDDISLNIPKTGIAESANTGNWKVKINDVILEGTDAKNYNLVQPAEVRVTIEKAEGILKIGCDSKIYDSNAVNPYVIQNNSTSSVTYNFYKFGTDEQVETPKKVGKYDVIGNMVSDGNYTEATTERVTFEITPKDITITNITSPDKIYDGTDRMTVTAGQLVGVCSGDTVSFTLPSVAYAENKNVGNHKIRLDSDIVLTGTDAYNYNLIQPTYGSITGNIVKRTISTAGIQGKTRKYDKTNLVEIIGGSIVNGVSGDDISLNIPKTGIAESANAGNWKVQIEDVILEGTDAKNYNLVQPAEVRVIIEKAEGILKIGCDSKIYDRIIVKPYVIENNSTSRVTYKFYKSGTDEQLETPKDVGKYDVIGSMVSDGNYTEATTERVTFEITPRDITITDIVVPDKVYNGTKNLNVTGGRLVGVYGGDDVTFSLPYLGYAESKKVGNHKIQLDEIVLQGNQARNYNLIQPEYGSVTSNILKKVINTEGISAVTKKYDGNNVVDITDGEIVGKVEGDELSLKIPETGLARNENAGEWGVKMGNILLEGADANNYELIQPDEFKVIIEKADGILIIGCDGKKFDRKPIEPYVVSNNSPSEVTFKYYKAGTDEEVDNPTDIGIYEVVGIIEEDENYTKTISERVKVEISKPDEPNLRIDSKIIAVNNEEIENAKEADTHYQDTIKIKVEVKNEGIGSGYLAKLLTEIPAGVEFIENSEINQKFGWKFKNGKLETTMYSFEENFESELDGISEDEENKNKVELELELKVTTPNKENKQMILPFEIEQQDKHGDKIEYIEENKENSKDEITMNLKYFDVSIDKTITLLTLTYVDSGKAESFDIYQRKGSALKMEVSEQRANTSFANLKYKITLENQGNENGVINQIVDILPKGTTFDTEDNPNWKIDSSGNAVYKDQISLNSGEKKEIEFVLKWDLRNYNLGTRKNQVFFEAEKEIDQILMIEKKLSIDKSDNIASSEMVFSLPTGSNSMTYSIIGIVIISIFGIGVYCIKKYVI